MSPGANPPTTASASHSSYPVLSSTPRDAILAPRKPPSPTKVDPTTALVDYSRLPAMDTLRLRKSLVVGRAGQGGGAQPYNLRRAAHEGRDTCLSCGAVCGTVRAECRQRPELVFCADCYAGGNYGELLTDRDFVVSSVQPEV